MPSTPTDEDFTHLVVAIWPRLYRTAYLMLGEHAAAEDLVQSALAKTYASWGKVRSLDAAPSYAKTIMINTALSWFRKKSWRNERPTQLSPEIGYDVQLDDRPTLVTALSELSPRQRAVIVLRYYEDLSVAETAAALGCAEGTVKSQTFDALSRLRSLLSDAVLPDIQGAHHD